MADLVDTNLVNAKGEEVPNSVLKEKKVIAFYFSAHWCPPCRGFTPVLVEAYNNAACKDFEIIFVSSDRDADSMREYMKETGMPWLAVPFGSATANKLKKQFGVTGIPTLIVLRADGSVITKNGRYEIAENQEEAIKRWVEQE
jgi:nucleoredoxin